MSFWSPLRRGLAAAMRPAPALQTWTRAGGKYRIAQGEDRSNNSSGPLHDLSDFHYASGQAASVTGSQLRWRREREEEQIRIDTLGREMWDLHNKWALRDQEKEKMQQQTQVEHTQAVELKEKRRTAHVESTRVKATKKAVRVSQNGAAPSQGKSAPTKAQ